MESGFVDIGDGCEGCGMREAGCGLRNEAEGLNESMIGNSEYED